MSGRPLRFTFVIARYGADILGGAERHARAVAERLAARGHDVRVLTSCASSYRTWANAYAAGTSVDGGVTVERFPVQRGRRMAEGLLKQVSHALPGFRSLARSWIRSQGPSVPDLHAHLPAEAVSRDLLVFFQLLSPTTIFGLPRVAEHSALVPLVHRERGVKSRLARLALTQSRLLLVNTPEEAATIRELAGPDVSPIRIVAVGLDTPPPASTAVVPEQPYVVFMGRTGKMKPLLQVWDVLTRDRSLPPLEHQGRQVAWRDVRLVITGEHSVAAATRPGVIQLGFLNDEARWAVMRGATALINPSLYESLSLILLEAWTVERAVVVNSRCDVTTGLVERSGGGVAVNFAAPSDAARAIANDLSSEARRAALGRNGHRFALANFVWERVLDSYEDAARHVAGG